MSKTVPLTSISDIPSVLTCFKEIVPIANPSGSEASIRSFIQHELTKLGLDDQQVDTAGNLFVRVPGDTSKPTLMLSAHMDSVPPCEGIVPVDDTQQGRPVIRSDGRTILGADDKSGIATIITVLRRLKKQDFTNNNPLELFLSTEEEVGLLGAKEFDVSQCKAIGCYVLDGEGRVGLVFNAGPYQDRLTIHCTGRAAHAGIAPESGVNAIAMLGDMISQLPTGRLADDLTTNMGLIDGGVALNVVAPVSTLFSDARSHDEAKLAELKQTYERVCKDVETSYKGSKAHIEHVRKYQGFCVPAEHPLVVAACDGAKQLGLVPDVLPMNIGSDAHVLNLHDLPTVVLGMGFHYSHSLGEFIYCEELELVVEWVMGLVSGSES